MTRLHMIAAAPGISSGERGVVAIIGLLAIAALVFAYVLVIEVRKADQGTPKMQEIAGAVQEGARAFLNRQFKTLAIFAVIVFLLLLVLPVNNGGFSVQFGRALFFIVGAVFSASVGYIGMTLATEANVRVAAAARGGGRERGFHIAFRTGGICGMLTVGLGLLGASVVLFIYNRNAPTVLEGFGFGGALLAMFMRVGGGIFTKAADVGADLVGKVEAGIPEDDPRNAATIADNVGDNVGDCAGMAADLFESYAVTLVAALILGQTAFGAKGLLLPLLIGAIGIISSAVGIMTTKLRTSRPQRSRPDQPRLFHHGCVVSLVLVAIAVLHLPAELVLQARRPRGRTPPATLAVIAFVAVLIGIVLAVLIQQTHRLLHRHRCVVRSRTSPSTSLTGAATVILAGISLGLESAVYSAILIAAGRLRCVPARWRRRVRVALRGGPRRLRPAHHGRNHRGSMDTFGPVSDNAQGIAEMSGDIDAELGARVLTDLDAVGNTRPRRSPRASRSRRLCWPRPRSSARSTRPSSDALATANLATPASNGQIVGGKLTGQSFSLDLSQPNNLVGVIIGASVVFLFSGLAISAVGRAAGRVVYEVRAQFRDPPRDHGLHREARLRPRRRHLHQGLAA